ncbi:MAG: hypothetical protein K1V75_00495 [Muribaculaceae bacterium]
MAKLYLRIAGIFSWRIFHILRRLGLTVAGGAAVAAASVTLTGCAVDVGWDPTPPYGWDDTFYDPSLEGCWRLHSINSRYVSGYSVNYLYFNGRGRGEYLYYTDGRPCTENTAYWCQHSTSGNSYYQINIQYESSYSPTTMNYWFTDGGDTLWMQWRNSYGLQTYVYVYDPRMPW